MGDALKATGHPVTRLLAKNLPHAKAYESSRGLKLHGTPDSGDRATEPIQGFLLWMIRVQGLTTY
jgi:hypothetical protein